MTTDVFVCRYAKGVRLRAAMFKVCFERWLMEPGIRLVVIDPVTPASAETFHIDKKRMAEEQAQSSIYVVCDDDALILGPKFVERGLAIMERNEEYTLCAATSIGEGEYPTGWQKWHENPWALGEVIPAHAVGCVSFVRKGVLKEFNDCHPAQVDDSICSELARKGHKTGAMLTMRFNHIGCGYSISSPGWWMQVPT